MTMVFPKKKSRDTTRVPNTLDPGLAQHNVTMLGLIWVQTVCKGYQQTTLSFNEQYKDNPSEQYQDLKLFNTLAEFLKELFEEVDFEKNERMT